MPVPLTKLLSKCQQGLAMGFAPQLAWDGTGGTYVLRDASRAPLAAFKPRDEEAFAPNNPRGLPGKLGQPGIHGSIASGEAHVREVLAHRLDHGHFASVPLTLQERAVSAPAPAPRPALLLTPALDRRRPRPSIRPSTSILTWLCRATGALPPNPPPPLPNLPAPPPHPPTLHCPALASAAAPARHPSRGARAPPPSHHPPFAQGQGRVAAALGSA